jgi:hypothetical protein
MIALNGVETHLRNEVFVVCFRCFRCLTREMGDGDRSEREIRYDRSAWVAALSGCRRLFRSESDAHADPRDPMGDVSTRNARNRIELEILEIQACNDAGYW